jgi:cytochrome d ubiquinol oxidase subunit II
METMWFILVAAMLIGYVVLDGFDLGAGALHLLAARTEEERRMVLHSIGPVWDGNEVWLVAAGGTLFYAFPLVYASSFSGFYLALNIVLWLLIFRALGIELRGHVADPLWRTFFDTLFALSSLLLIVFFGAALGNVVRGAPLGSDHYFFLPLWTDFRPGAQPGILDWYTILSALTAVAALGMHGALYVVLKTEGELNRRMRRIAGRLWPATAARSGIALLATIQVRPAVLNNYRDSPAGWVIPVVVVASLAGVAHFSRVRHEWNAFLSSCVYLTGMLSGAAYGLYPALLPSSGDPSLSLTIHNAAAGASSLAGGIYWWGAGMAIAVGYFVLVYTMFRGKVTSAHH